MAVYQVLVVDDSAFMRKIVSDLIEADPEFKVAATASNGKEAIQKSLDLKPDIITMDVEMPEMNGLDALKSIMKHFYVPVIMLSGINEQGMKETIMALEAGAFDFIRKPSVSQDHDIKDVGKALIERMRAAMDEIKQREKRRAAASQKREEAQMIRLDPPTVQAPQAETKKANEKAGDATKKQAMQAEQVKRAPSEKNEKLRIPPKPIQSSDKDSKASKQPAAPKSKPALQTDVTREPSETHSTKRSQPARSPQEIRPNVSTRLGSDQVAAASASDNAKRTAQAVPARKQLPGIEGSFNKIIAIGCSTGGPRALKTLLEQLPADLPAPVVIVQHMPPNFTRSLAQRLNTFSPLQVVEAEEGMVLQKGTAYIAPGGYHLKVNKSVDGKYVVKLTEEQPVNGHRPSVDTMFESLMGFASLQRHLVLLTGMGSDGARMMKKMYDAGVTSTFAENEETCVVYGMPRSAVELQCVRHLLPLQGIAPKLVQAVK